MKHIVAVAAAVVLLAGILWAALPRTEVGARGAPSPTPVAAGSPFAGLPELGELREALAREREERRALSEEVAWLRAEVQLLSELGYDEGADPGLDPAPPDAEPAPDETPYFDEELLLARGLRPDEVSELREQFEATEMRELFLRDRAMREGWFRSPRWWNAQRSVHLELRQELGDEAYDRMIYAAGRRNRVRVSHVLHDSPALEAGLEVGDLILSYGPERIFSPRDLQYATSTTAVGTTVRVTVLRDGEERAFYLPAGPIGTRISRARAEPIL